MRQIQLLSLFAISLTSALYGQNILGQYMLPYQPLQTGPYYVVAQFATPDGSGGLFYFDPSANTLHRFDSTGKELWNTSLSFGSLPTSQGLVSGLAVAADGVYLGGHTNGALPGQTNAGSYDPFLVKYDLTGKMLWTRQFGTAATEYVRTVALGPNGVYVLGVAGPTTPFGFFVQLIDPSGNEVWTRNFTDAVLSNLVGASADATGVYFFGYTAAFNTNILRKFDASGNDLWTYQFDKQSLILNAAPDGQGVYVEFFSDDGAGDPKLSVRRLDPNGSEIWTRDNLPSSASGAIAADVTGFYLAAPTLSTLPGQCYAGDLDVFLMRFDTGGAPLWTREWGTAGPDRPASIAIGASSVDVSGFSAGQTTFVTTLEKSSAAPTQTTIHNECVLNAANYLGGGVAPGEIVTIIGSAMGPSELVKLQPTADGQIPTTLAGARILFNGEPAPLIYVSDQQSSAIVPYDLAGKSSASVQVEYNGVQSSPVVVPVFDARLGVFSFGENGAGEGAIINEDGTVNSPFNPAAAGTFVSIYATGGGLTSPVGADNQITGANPMPISASTYVRLDSDGSCDAPYYPAAISYYGGAPESVPGLMQINVQLPAGAPVGDAVPLYIGLNSGPSVEQMVTIAIR